MIIIRLKGGLGNQLFQYAASRALAQRHGALLRLDTTWYDGETPPGPDRRTFDLRAFRISAPCASHAELARFGGAGATSRRSGRGRRLLQAFMGHRVWRNDDLGFVPELGRLGSSVYLEGYFQHPAHFAGIEEVLRSECVLVRPMEGEALCFGRRLAEETSVCIQVRRTDFVHDEAKARVHNVCGPDYHRKAWDRLREEVPGAKGYVFTDDNVWARNHFDGWGDVEVVPPEMDGPGFMHRFELMRACRHFIIMNSTWGWWAAWLGAKAGSRVVMPEQWVRDRTTRELGFVCRGWETA